MPQFPHPNNCLVPLGLFYFLELFVAFMQHGAGSGAPEPGSAVKLD